MKKISKRLTVVIAVLFTAALSLCAGTTVYLFVPAIGNMDVTLLIDGEEVCDLNTPVGKTTNFHTFKIPSTQSKKGWVEIEFGQEGKVLLAVSLVYTNFLNLEKSTFQAETQLDLVDGETIYVDLARKGWNDCQLKFLDEKKGAKKLADKKAFRLPKVEYCNENE